MANRSFMEMIFEDALASGLARELARAERPPPENFFLLPSDVKAWREIQVASKNENMVICLEITRNGNEKCKMVQSIFMDMARKFENVPFLRVSIQPFATFDELRKDVGGVKFTPTILAIFFDNNNTVSRAKYEGYDEIIPAVQSGRITEVIKGLLQRRVKLKVKNGIVGHLSRQVSDRESKVREDYEQNLQSKLKELEEVLQEKEEALKKEAERKKKEEEVELAKVHMQCQAEEKLKEERPRYVKELLEMDLDKASGSSLKMISKKLGISTLGCVEKQELKEALIANVPELRIRTSHQPPVSSDHSCRVGGSGGSAESAVSSSEVETLRRELSMKKSELELADLQLAGLKKEMSDLKSMVAFGGRRLSKDSKESVATSEKDLTVIELEMKLQETRMLYTTCLDDFDVLGTIHESDREVQNDALVLRVKCKKTNIPHKDRVYAMKVITNFFRTQTQSEVQREYHQEYQVLCHLPPHENIIHLWAYFFGKPDPNVSKHFKMLGDRARTMSLFILMDEHLSSMTEHLEILTNIRGPKSSQVLHWIKDLLSGLLFLTENNVVHLDLKLDNLLLSSNGRLVISDFGKSLVIDTGDFRVPHTAGYVIGGNEAHLAPEILNSRSGIRKYLNYSKQPVWAAGVLNYELAGHANPFQSLEFSQHSYSMDELPPLRKTYCTQQSFCEALPQELIDLTQAMLDPDEDKRPTLGRCLNVVEKLV